MLKFFLVKDSVLVFNRDGRKRKQTDSAMSGQNTLERAIS